MRIRTLLSLSHPPLGGGLEEGEQAPLLEEVGQEGAGAADLGGSTPGGGQGLPHPAQRSGENPEGPGVEAIELGPQSAPQEEGVEADATGVPELLGQAQGEGLYVGASSAT